MSKRVAEITVPATLEVTSEAPPNRQPSMFRDGDDVWVVRKPYRANTAIQTFLCQIVSRTSQKRAT